jgi:hypothetical protein
MILAGLSVPIILILINKKMSIRKVKDHYKLTIKVLITVILLISLQSALYNYATFQVNKRWGWFTHTQFFADNFAALQWIDRNISSDDLILNDASFISQYVISLSPKKVVYHRWVAASHLNPELNKQAKELFKIWEKPDDVSLVKSLLRKYGVVYLFSTSEPYYWRDFTIFGGPAKVSILKKPLSPKEYAEIFDQYDFLEPVFVKNSVRIYRVAFK